MGMLVVPTWKNVNNLGKAGQEITEADPGRHGQENPQGQEALHEAQAFGRRWRP